MSELCIKCGESQAVILIGTNGKFCRNCFQYHFSHKFRASLGKNPVVRHGERVAVAFSGGSNSSALLNLLLAETSPDAYKKLKFHPGIIFIDDTAVLPDGDYSDSLSAISAIMERSGLPYDVFKLEEVLDCQEKQPNDSLSQTSDLSAQLKALFDSLTSVTCKEELLYRMRCKLLTRKAKALGYQHVFLGETSTRLAVNILSNIAQGRGSRLPLDTQFSDGGCLEGVNLLRPLRDVTAKEVCVYNAMHKVPTVFLPTFSTKLASNSSIQRLTEDFIVSLSANFPSTETTIYRTSNKLQMNSQRLRSKNTTHSDKNGICYLCGGPQDKALSKDKAMALNAMNITKMLCNGQHGIPEACNKLASTFDEQCLEDNADTDEISPTCHACTILVDDVRSPDASSDIQQTLSELLRPSHPGLEMTEDELTKKTENVFIGR